MKINYVNSIYGEIGVKSLSAQLGLCRTRMAKAKLLSLNEILRLSEMFYERSAVSEVIKLITLLHVNPYSSV